MTRLFAVKKIANIWSAICTKTTLEIFGEIEVLQIMKTQNIALRKITKPDFRKELRWEQKQNMDVE